ncbi:MAG: LysR substrate-binding domain-containing protein, partial [Cyanobacteria bacterium]|nr:LysR substrate-binding domain-containing protein [Cyanobacteriota bacterium]MDW8202043.1 LysR substrate-binding domain-containing protein [Cyanobacteriota bacterium SKYGB_h_bin112]
MRQITLHQLKVFEAAARHCSFTRAAEELFLTQPTVSMQVKQLTQAVGIPLFEQVGKRLHLTDAGRELYKTCRDVFEQLSQFEMTIADMQGLKQGKLRLCVITTAKYVVPRLLGPFCQRYPGVDVSLQVTNHEGVAERMSENLDDLYIVSEPPDHPEIESFAFIENPLVVVAPKNHPLVTQRQISLQRIADEPFIMREPGSGTRKTVQELFDVNKVPIRIKLEIGSNEAIKQAVAGGLGIAVLSLHSLTLEGTFSQVAILDVEKFPIARQWYVIYPAGKQLSTVART